MISDASRDILVGLDGTIGEKWALHALRADAADDFLHVIIADGMFSTKVDGFSHAAHMTTPYMLSYMQEQDLALNLSAVTEWEKPAGSAIRFAHIQVEFHWKIDTRLWQYLLYTKFMRRAYDDAIIESAMDEEDKQLLLQAITRFWDEVEVAYCYRMEVIERSRGFTPHPDETAGSKDHGYAYRKFMEAPDYTFDELKFSLFGQELGAGTNPSIRTPAAWPGLSQLDRPALLASAYSWYTDAKKDGLADAFLRAKLGERMVPTRNNGWEKGLIETNEFLIGDGDVLSDIETVEERALLFAQSQYSFVLRLSADPADYFRLIRAQKNALTTWHTDSDDEVDVERFFELVGREFTAMAQRAFSEEDLKSDRLDAIVDGTRPIHPRYASYDPLEPLPWQTRSPERYLARMKRLGYTL